MSGHQTVRQRVDARAEGQGEAPFLISPENDLAISYAALHEHCESIAGRLRGLGLATGDKVAFLLDNGPWTASLFLSTMYAGMVTVPLNAVAGVPQVAYVLEHCDASVLFVSDKYAEQFAEAIAACPRSLTLIRADVETGPGEWPMDAVEASVADVDGAADALLLYTSGTTGMPKGARLSQRAVLAGGENTALAHQLTSTDRALCVLPLYHINAEMVTVMGPLASGGSVVMPQRFSATDFWNHVTRYHCTWVSVVPTIIKYLLDRAAREPWQFGESPELSQLRFGRSASAPLPASVQQEFESTFKVPMVETMGLTETCAPILSNPMPPASRVSGSPGIAFGNEVRVADDAGASVADTTVGELLVRGANVLSGYYKNPQASAGAFHPDGWFRTGDLGYRDEKGYFFITGRSKELIIKGGENIAPREIDDALYLHEAVLEAAAVGVDHAGYGQDVVACVRLRDGYEATEATLIEHCKVRVGTFKAPSRIHFMAELPKGPSGKIQRLKLPELLLADTNP
ncbi:MAG: AMP-binding protein [Chromatiales bacterium]|jgi:acyl-CoA synthetase (AMP-forming)/AMP-acid ligase II|nr:AMP-binding protein [Chromatiales bacterium]